MENNHNPILIYSGPFRNFSHYEMSDGSNRSIQEYIVLIPLLVIDEIYCGDQRRVSSIAKYDRYNVYCDQFSRDLVQSSGMCNIENNFSALHYN